MIDLKNISNVYLIGIGGIGMSALARYFKQKRKTVKGYDRIETNLTQQLINEGINVSYEDDISNLDTNADLVIYTPAIPNTNAIKRYYEENEKTSKSILKRAEILEYITKDYRTIAIAGTHGKTTITALTSWIATVCGIDATAFIGGICNNYNSNFKFGESEYMIVEADEFVNKTENKVIAHSSVQIKNNQKVLSYGLKLKDKKIPFYAYNISTDNGKQFFDLCLDGQHIENISTILPGKYNIENAVAASAINYLCGASLPKIKEGIESFEGVLRRFQYIINTEKLIVIDDYAHHPKELEALITTVKTLYPNKKISILFQPHLYSRTKDFAAEFGESLNLTDEVFVTEIYPARELPIEGVNAELILKNTQNTQKAFLTKEKVLDEFYKREFEVLLIAGAGDIDKLVEPIKEMFNKKLAKK